MQKSVNTLANGMFVKEHTFNSGTKIINLSIKANDFVQFMKSNFVEDKKGSKWVNLKLIPNKTIGENKLTHTPILNDFKPQAVQNTIETPF
jgi:hypothetical protein